MNLHSTVPFSRPVPVYSVIRTGRKKARAAAAAEES